MLKMHDRNKIERLKQVFGSKSRVTWLMLEPLGFSAVSSLVSRTLHRSKEDCLQLTRMIYRSSGGNAFSARNFLTSLQRHHHVCVDNENQARILIRLALRLFSIGRKTTGREFEAVISLGYQYFVC